MYSNYGLVVGVPVAVVFGIGSIVSIVLCAKEKEEEEQFDMPFSPYVSVSNLLRV